RVVGPPDLEGARHGAVVLVDGVEAVDGGGHVRYRGDPTRRGDGEAEVGGGARAASGEAVEEERDRHDEPLRRGEQGRVEAAAVVGEGSPHEEPRQGVLSLFTELADRDVERE